MRKRAVLLVLLLGCLASAAAAAAERLTIPHTNDVHGHLRPCGYPAISSPGSGSLIAGGMQGGSLFADLDDARVYSCAAGSSLVARLDGYELREPRATGRRWTDVVLDAIRKARTLAPAYDGRRVVVDTLRVSSRGE